MKKSIIFIVSAVILVIGVYIYRYLDSPVETRVAQMTEHEEIVEGDAYFVRKESVYNAEASGTFYAYAREGARVGKNRLVAAVYNTIVDTQMLRELNNLDKKITELEDYSRNNNFVADEANSESRLKNLKNQIISSAAAGDPSAIYNIKKDIKSIVSGETVTNDNEDIELLKRQKSSIEAKLGYSKKDIYSDCSGVFSANIDGLENILTIDKLEEYTVADFDSAAEHYVEPVSRIAALGGESVCKVIDNHTWYVMAKVSAGDAEKLKDNKNVDLRFESIPGVETSATLVHISNDENAEYALAIFECEQYVEGIFSIRSSHVEIILEQYRGFEIPMFALRVKDGQQGVMVQYGVNEIFKPCKVIFTDKDREVIIIEPVTENIRNPLEQFDKIVIGEKKKTAETGT